VDVIDFTVAVYRARVTMFHGPKEWKLFRKLVLSWGRNPADFPVDPPEDCGGRSAGSVFWVKDPRFLEPLVHELHHVTYVLQKEYGLDGFEDVAYLYSHCFGYIMHELKKRGILPKSLKECSRT
jgi:hypothetical protein